MLVFSHRGFHVSLPENTLEAFQAAVDLGVDGIETDLRLSADGEVILFHDRLSPDGREVASLTRLELSRAVGYHVPSLQEVLDRFEGITWMPEIKVPQVVPRAMEILAGHAPLRRLIVTSFWHTVVNQMRQVARVECGVLVAHRPLDLSMTQLGWHPEFDPIRCIVWKYDVADPELLLQARAAGLMNFVYDVENQDDHRRCSEIGIDGVITDRPDYLLSPGSVQVQENVPAPNLFTAMPSTAPSIEL